MFRAWSGSDVATEIVPHSGVGPVRFGMTRAEVRERLGAGFSELRRVPASPPMDVYCEQGYLVHYDEDGRCEAVELLPDARPALRGRELVGRAFDQLTAWFERLDPQVEVDTTGLTSPAFGLSLYAPDAEGQPGAPVECVLVFRRGWAE